MQILTALSFLTCLPVRLRRPPDERDLAGSMVYFPLIGFFLGSLLVLLNLILSPLLPIRVVNLALLILLAGLTGGLHLDGLADTIDGLAGGREKEQRLAIMRDSRIGALGALALILLLLAKYELLCSLSGDHRNILLLLMPAMGRWSQVMGAGLFPSARPGMGSIFVKVVGIKELIWTTLMILPFCLLLGLFQGLLFCLINFGAALVLFWLISRRIGGLTGDSLGAVSETIEVVSLVIGLLMVA
ncbi:MAG: adenosylcobinamide-GDP ribazoletransferase [bacterium]